MNGTDKLLYEKANTYRLHADNLRWTLLGGYVAFFAAVMLQLKDTGVQPNLQTALVFLAICSVSIFYLFIMAVQSWYYNLFSEYVEACERRLVSGKKLEALSEFTEHSKAHITPLHPSFSFALYVVALTSLGFLLPVVRYIVFCYNIDIQNNIGWFVGSAILWLMVYIIGFNLLLRYWQNFTYPIISFLLTDESRRRKQKK